MRNDVLLSAAQPEITRMVGAEPITIKYFPFLVGRETSKLSDAMSPSVKLAVPDTAPFQLSRRHFTIEKEGDSIIVRDYGSHNGTIVNGFMLGTGSRAFHTVLAPGENNIIAGTLISKFQFTCLV
jgi:pSer/pThr/pTyr-binding forkhead associated (FHA) protein